MFNDKARVWYLGAAVVSVLVLVAGWFLLVAPQRASADDLNTQAESVETANVATQAQIASLKAQYKDLPTLQQQLAAMQQRLPAAPSMPALLRSLNQNATTAGIRLDEFTPEAPAPLVVDATSKDTSVATPGTLNAIPVTLLLEGRFANVQLYLKSLEALKRSFLVTGVDIERLDPSDTVAPGTLKLTITGRVFMAVPGTAPAAKTTTATTTTTAPAS